jgi:hypothetical protein
MVVPELVNDAGRVFQELGTPPDAILITGDIAFSADRQHEYSRAHDWIRRLCSAVKVGEDRVFPVPGNHDVQRELARGPLGLLLHKELRRNPGSIDNLLVDREAAAALLRKFESYDAFAERYGPGTATATQTWWTARLSSDLGPLALVGLNTAVSSFDDGDANTNLILGKLALSNGIQQQPENVLRIVLQHHPPSWLADGSELVGWLRERPHVLFTGHVHEQAGAISASFGGGGILQIAAGAGHGEAAGEHGYSWVSLDRAGLRFYPRVWSRTRKRFVADKNSFAGIDEGGCLCVARAALPEPLRRWIAEAVDVRPADARPHDHPPADGRSVSGGSVEDPFRRRIAEILRLQGYGIESLGSTSTPMMVLEPAGLGQRRQAVFCVESSEPIDRTTFERIAARLTVVRGDRSAGEAPMGGIIATSVGFVKGLLEDALPADIRLVRISELEQGIVDFRPYVDQLIRTLDGQESTSYFIEPTLLRENRIVPESALKVVDEWTAHPETNQLTLLGDYGTGKTTFLKHIALRLARQYQDASKTGARVRVPIYVDLKDYTHAISLKTIILELFNDFGIRASYGAFQHVLSDGQVLLILDGFDEMASRGNRDATLRNFRELNTSAMGRAKIILSCRTHYFKTERDVRRFLGEAAPVRYTQLYRDVSAKPNFVITYLQEFNENQVDSYLRRRCGSDSSAMWDFIEGHYNLRELARRPVLLDMIVASKARFRERETVTTGQLYLRYTDLWLGRNDWEMTSDIDTKTMLLERFAARAMAAPDSKLGYQEIPELIRSSRTMTHDDAMAIDRELRTASFLVSDGQGSYHFSHPSFLEFFYARYLLSQAARGTSEAWAQGAFRREIYRFLRDLIVGRDDQAIANLVTWIRDTRIPSQARVNAVKAVCVMNAPDVQDALLELARSEDTGDAVAYTAITGLGYHADREVQEFLRGAIISGRYSWIAVGNALRALARIDTPEARDYLVELIDHGVGGNELTRAQFWSITSTPTGTAHSSVVRACIRYAQRHPSREVLGDCLKMCARLGPCGDVEEMSEWTLKRTESPKLMALAASLLPVERRRSYAARLCEMAADEARTGRERLVPLLEGLGTQLVEQALLRLVGQEAVAAEAHRILVNDFPATAVSVSKELVTRAQGYALRVQAARALAQAGGPDGLEVLWLLLARRQRSTVKISALGMIKDHYPKDLDAAVRHVLHFGGTPTEIRYALELVLQEAPQSALGIILEPGPHWRRVGTRATVVELLGSVHDSRATDELLRVLEVDDDGDVRLRALRSLLVPGRAIERSRLRAALRHEKRAEVLELVKDFALQDENVALA